MANNGLDRQNFNWLSRAYRGPTYTSYSQFSHLPYCSFEWGEDGYAGCCNHGGELLYLSRPSKDNGLIMARGHFATSLYASLSRSQIDFGGPSTFGLEVSRCPYAYDPEAKEIIQQGKQKDQNESADKDASGVEETIQEGKEEVEEEEKESANKNASAADQIIQDGMNEGNKMINEDVQGADDTPLAGKKDENEAANEEALSASNGSTFCLGNMIDRGCFNYRWPVTEYYLDLHPNYDVIENEKEREQENRGTEGEENAPNDTPNDTPNNPHNASQRENSTNDAHNDSEEKHEEKKKEHKSDAQNPSQARHVGTCQMFSCAKGDMFYQVLRIEESRVPVGDDFDASFPRDSQIVLTMGGPVWFESFNDGEHDLKGGVGVTTARASFPPARRRSRDHDNAGGQREKVIDTSGTEPTYTIRYWDENKNKGEEKEEDKKVPRGLEAKVYQLLENGEYKPLPMRKSKAEADNGPKGAEGSTNLTAYNAVGKLESSPAPLNKIKAPRSATFLAVIRLFEGGKRGGGKWPMGLLSSTQLYDHVGVNPSCFHATGAMWENIFLDRRKGPDPVLDLAEFNMIGRSLEKILQVDIVPATFDDDRERGHKDYAALVSNRFVRGNVDLKSLFWKIRFLIRIHKLLSHICMQNKSTTQNQGESPEPKDEFHSIEEAQMHRIQTKVEDVVRYLVKALLQPSTPKLNTRMIPDDHIQGESNYYYVMMTIWYVWKHFEEYLKDNPGPALNFDWASQWPESKKPLRHRILLEPYRLPSDNWTFRAADREKVQLLQWYHYGSLLKLCKHKVLPESWKGVGLELEHKVARLAKAAKMASSAKLSSREPYVADDEVFDRLSFVFDELGFENLGSDRVSIVESLAMARVKQRDFTRSLNPGWLPRDEEASTSGPWEIHALCHHSRLVVLTKEEKSKQDWRAEEHTKDEAEIFRYNIRNFLNAEGTLIPCWERAHAKARRGWLRSEATPVVATTLAIILEKRMPTGPSDSSVPVDNNDTNSPSKPSGSTSPPAPDPIAVLSRTVQEHNEQVRDAQKNLLLEVRHLESLMTGQLEAFEKFTNESGRQPPIQWKSFRPTRKYHPVSFFNSLEDTPDLYKAAEIGKVAVPLSLCDYISRPDELRNQKKDFEKKDIEFVLPKKCLVLFDIKAKVMPSGKDEDEEGFTWQVEKYKYDDSNNGKNGNNEFFSWALYDNLVDQEVQHRFLTVIPLRDCHKTLVKYSDRSFDKQPDKKSNKKRLSNIPKEVLELLVYVTHPESAPCLGDYLLNLSRFSCQTGETWVASITLKSWRVCEEAQGSEEKKDKKRQKRNEKEKQNDDGQQDPSDDCHDFRLPPNLRQVWGKESVRKRGFNERTIFKPEVSSIILSTNSFGDFSKCAVVSGLFDDDKLDDQMEAIIKEARKLWQKFIHQPQTARCLVFFLLLGKFCHEITAHYERAIDKLSSILNLDSTFTNTEDEYPPEFELGVWSLDALHKLQNSLNATVASLSTAKEDLTAQIINGPGKRSVKLERMCQEYLGQFENNLVQLFAVNVKLERRIELNTRNKDATSAVLTMRDSRTAISQNSTVQRLTYLTIAYLPIALMAAIFAIPQEMNVLFLHMASHGRSWFVGAIFVMSFATYVLAVYIGNVLDFFRYPPRIPSKGGKKPRSEQPPNVWEWLRVPTLHAWLGLIYDVIFNFFHDWAHNFHEENWRKHEEPEGKAPTPQNKQNAADGGNTYDFTPIRNWLSQIPGKIKNTTSPKHEKPQAMSSVSHNVPKALEEGNGLSTGSHSSDDPTSKNQPGVGREP